MNKTVDVIGIGAINFDFIFDNVQRNRGGNNNLIDDGEETFVDKSRFESLFNNCNKHAPKDKRVQVGGSALLAIRTLKDMCPELKIGYVGVYGDIPKYAKDTSLPKDSNGTKEFISKFVDNDEWLFHEKEETGCALVKLRRHKRASINIQPGANNKLKQKIESKGEKEFVDYLSSARWIHLSSLFDIEQFCFICESIKQAKEKNPYLIFSVDPGYDYTKNHWDELKKIFPIADFVFLSQLEKNNIWDNLSLTDKEKFEEFGNELLAIRANPQIIIVKNVSNIVLLNMISKSPFIRKYHHKKISKFRIANDTGAGDAFAGGFIAGMLSPVMLSYQPASIHLGASAARERLLSYDWPTKLKHVSIEFKKKNMRKEQHNIRQWIQANFIPIINLIIGAALGVFADFIIDLIKTLMSTH